jgi:hypothetical protein
VTLSSGQITWSTAKPSRPRIERAVLELRRADARDAWSAHETVMRHLAGDQVGLVQRRAGDEQVGILDAGVLQHRGLDAVADHAAQVEPLLQLAQALPGRCRSP